MHFKKIEKLQAEYGYTEIQGFINSGSAWRLEGSVGREAMSLIESGVCMLPKEPRFGAYGNRIPSRTELKGNSKGTFKNCSEFWTKVENGEIDLFEN